MKKKIRLVYASIIILLVIVVIAIVFFVAKKKKNAAFQEIKVIENDEVKIEVVNISKMNEYLAIEYSVTAKKSSYFDAYADTTEGTDYLLYDVVKINDQLLSSNMQMSERISGTELKLIELVDISDINIEGNPKVEISVYSDSNMVEEHINNVELDDDSEEYIEVDYDIYDDVEDEEIEEEEFYEDDFEDERFAEVVEGDFVVGETNSGSDNTSKDDNSKETSEKEDNKKEAEDNEDEISDDDRGFIGTLKFELDMDKAAREITFKDIKNEKIDLNENISIISIQEMITQTDKKIIIVNSEINNISTEDENSVSPANFSLNIQDENNNTIDVAKCEIIDLLFDDGRKWSESSLEELDNGKAAIKTVMLVDNDLTKLKLQPIYQDTYEISLDEWNGKEWHKVEDGKFEGNNNLGGKVNITKIEEKNGELLFYYNTSGCISEDESVLIVKNVNQDGMYEACTIRRKNGDDKIAGYVVDNDALVEDDKFIVVNDLEFSIFEGLTFETLGTGIDIQI